MRFSVVNFFNQLGYFECEIDCDKQVVIYSDGYGSQNRNVTLFDATF